MTAKTPPKQWHLYIVDLEPRVGTKPGKQRPCLTIQPSEFGEAGLHSTVVIPITSQVIPGETYPLRVKIPKDSCALTKESDLLIDQILAWDNKLFRKELGPLPEALRDQVKEAIKDFLDL
jgi:mRNA interferase MazF